MKRIGIIILLVCLLLMLSACSVYPPGTIVIVQGETTPSVTTPVATLPSATTPVATTPMATTPVITIPMPTTPMPTTPVPTTSIATTPAEITPPTDYSTTLFVVSVNTKKYHLPTCHYAKQVKKENRKEVVGLAEFTEEYAFCKVCLPDLQSE
jgi:hypothetical protein